MHTEPAGAPRHNPLELEDPVAQQVAELRHLKTQFLASLNHQIRTPMSGILGMIELLMETPLDSRQREYLVATRICAQDLFHLLSASLDFSSLASGSVHLEETEFDLVEVLESSLMDHALQAESKGLELASNLSPGLPQLALGDPERLRQLLSQLLSNAVKFTERGYVELCAAPAPAGEGRFLLEVAVRDTGPGIAPDQQRHIFESFRRASRQLSGLGLGLAIAQRIAALMGGEIRVSSEPGKGSIFSFAVPLGLTADLPRPAPSTAITGKYVLVLHPHPVVGRGIASLLEQLHARPFHAGNLEQAARILERQHAGGEPVWAVILDDQGLGENPAVIRSRLKAVSNPFLVSLVWPSRTERPAPAGCYDAELAKPVRRYPLYDILVSLLARAAGPDRKQRRILIAEDNLVSQRLVAHILRRGGYEVDAVSGGRASINAVQARDGDGYDLILMDLQMPDMNGLEAAEVIRKLPGGAGVPIVALTADTSEELRAECRQKGLNGYLVKPIKSEELLSAIARFFA